MAIISELVFHVDIDIESAKEAIAKLEEKLGAGLLKEDAIKEFDIRQYIKLETKIKEE